MQFDFGGPLSEAIDEIPREGMEPRRAGRDPEEPSLSLIDQRKGLLDPPRARQEGPGFLDEVFAGGCGPTRRRSRRNSWVFKERSSDLICCDSPD